MLMLLCARACVGSCECASVRARARLCVSDATLLKSEVKNVIVCEQDGFCARMLVRHTPQAAAYKRERPPKVPHAQQHSLV